MIDLLEIALPLNLNKTYDYLPPRNINRSDITTLIGKRVIVRFGNKLLTGVVTNTKQDVISYDYKEVVEVIDKTPLFSLTNIKLLDWVCKYYLAPIGEVYKTAFPLGLSKSSKKEYFLNQHYENILKETQVSVDLDDIDLVYLIHKKIGFNKPFSQNSLLLKSNGIVISDRVFKKLLKIDILCAEETLIQNKISKENIYFLDFDTFDNERIEEIKRTLNRSKTQLKLLDFLLEKQISLKGISNPDSIEKNSFGCTAITETQIKKEGFSVGVINKLLEKSIIEKKEVDKNINDYQLQGVSTTRKNELLLKLNQEQEQVYTTIKQKLGKQEVVLLYGITGSGKTLVYLKLINDLIGNQVDGSSSTNANTNAEKKRVLLLLPEISLTPQMIDRFQVAFPGRIVVLHSKLTDKQRYENWINIANSKYDIVIGVRSAVFAPIQNLGLIIVDEEHDSSYKQEGGNNNYNARDVAIVRGKIEGCVVLLGSATPSIESYHNAQINKYSLLEIKKRNDGANLPEFEIIDKKVAEFTGQNFGLFSKTLLNKIIEKVDRSEQVILFLNRRGYAPVLECNSCSNSEKCPNCDITLTYHKTLPHFQCHCCGFTIEDIKKCSYCNSKDFKMVGFGTQRIEEDLLQVLNKHSDKIRAIRLDADTAAKQKNLKTIISDFEKQKYNVLIGTQMISKGLDFENVTLVGLLNPDLSLHFSDFRASERNYQLLTQVSGRAGRSSNKKGLVVLQTTNKEHYSVKAVITNNPDMFYSNELEVRKNTEYPPYFRVYKLEFKSKDESVVSSAAKLFFKNWGEVEKKYVVYPPTQPVIAFRAGLHRKHIIIKVDKSWDKSGQTVNSIISAKLNEFWEKFKYSNLKIKVEVDAYNLTT